MQQIKKALNLNDDSLVIEYDNNSGPNEGNCNNEETCTNGVNDPMTSTRIRRVPKYLADYKLWEFGCGWGKIYVWGVSILVGLLWIIYQLFVI